MPKNKSWSEQHTRKYDWLYNYLKETIPDLKKEDYIHKMNKRVLVNMINNNQAWGSSSKEGIFFMVARWLEMNSPDDVNVKYFQALGYRIKKKKDEHEGENTLDDKEKENFKEHEYFISF